MFGLPAEILCDAEAAADVEEGRALVPCWGNEDDLADRWDARCAAGAWVCICPHELPHQLRWFPLLFAGLLVRK